MASSILGPQCPEFVEFMLKLRSNDHDTLLTIAEAEKVGRHEVIRHAISLEFYYHEQVRLGGHRLAVVKNGAIYEVVLPYGNLVGGGEEILFN